MNLEIYEKYVIASKTDLNGVITYVSDKFCEISGYSKEELIGEPHNILRHPDMDSEAFEDLWSSIKRGESWQGEVKNLKKNGDYYWVRATISPSFKDGKVIGYSAVREDITDKKKAQSLQEKIEKIYQYDREQQEIARSKVESNIIKNCSDGRCGYKVDYLFIPSDILSGDFFSAIKYEENKFLIYILDGQGHGVSPALTVFAISSIINRFVSQKGRSFEDLAKQILPTIQNFLSDYEQLSISLFFVNLDAKRVKYIMGGMYPAYLKIDGVLKKIKNNNFPIMNWTESIKVDSIYFENLDSLMLYSDGLVEVDDERFQKYHPEKFLENPNLFSEASKEMKNFERDDDITLISFYSVV